eukprot:gnl/MRDRNA2_/MRDRNA2_204889_c0_seq1.p1 gnl/MRDRNA2_/MRDRNA2_204889_c0~~gnl/MRDRNA2_/MRDRNA2_204889_c0_seq1.p1  ORF type:complete len:477 (-),score=106.36 gnl/MRDRNA2_/MRDRNA2_204889_c0_seq1:132-1418(-)
MAFLGLYMLELGLRFMADGFRLLCRDGWVRFDTFVLSIALLDLFVIGPLMKNGGGEAKQIAMVLRIMRLMKLARIVRLLRFFKELWLLVSSFGSAFKTLAWTFMLLGMVLYVFGILFVKMLGKENDDEEIQEWFGSLGAAMFTLFQVVTLENWSDITRKIWTTEQWYMAPVVVVFIAICSFAIMNTVMAVIVEHTLGEAMDQKDDLIKKAEAEMREVAGDLLRIFAAADKDGGGTLDKKEFIDALGTEDTRRLLQKMDLGEDIGCLDPEEIGMLFDTIDVDHNTELSPQEFVNGIMQMRGGARARRIFELHCDQTKLRNKMVRAFKEIRDDIADLKKEGLDVSSRGYTKTKPQLDQIGLELLNNGNSSQASNLHVATEPSSAIQAIAALDAKLEKGLAVQNQAIMENRDAIVAIGAKLDAVLKKISAR